MTMSSEFKFSSKSKTLLLIKFLNVSSLSISYKNIADFDIARDDSSVTINIYNKSINCKYKMELNSLIPMKGKYINDIVTIFISFKDFLLMKS